MPSCTSPFSTEEALITEDVRLARPDEADAVAALVHDAYEHYIPRLGRKPGPMMANYAALIDQGYVYVISTAVTRRVRSAINVGVSRGPVCLIVRRPP